MNKLVEKKPAHTHPARPTATSERSCTVCAVEEFNFCAAVGVALKTGTGDVPCLLPLGAVAQKISARRIICHLNERSESVPVICQGWAALTIALPGGRRQILSFLLPGDTVSMAYLFGPMPGRIVDAITDVTFRSFKRYDLQTLLFKDADFFETVMKAWVEEEERSVQLTVDLGRRTADERLARLILTLAGRLTKRGMMRDLSMEFPLRQHHIADATGLTPVHVSKVIGEFQRADLIEINNRSLTIVDLVALRRVGGIY